MRARAVDKALRNGPLTHGQKAAVKLIVSAQDRTIGVQGYAGTGKTTMLSRARALLEKKGFTVRGLAPSASAARTLAAEAGIGGGYEPWVHWMGRVALWETQDEGCGVAVLRPGTVGAAPATPGARRFPVAAACEAHGRGGRFRRR